MREEASKKKPRKQTTKRQRRCCHRDGIGHVPSFCVLIISVAKLITLSYSLPSSIQSHSILLNSSSAVRQTNAVACARDRKRAPIEVGLFPATLGNSTQCNRRGGLDGDFVCDDHAVFMHSSLITPMTHDPSNA